MCPHAWQDQYNLHEKGGLLVDMRLLLLSLKAIKRVCGQEDPTNPMLLATRKLHTASKRVQSNLVLKLQPES